MASNDERLYDITNFMYLYFEKMFSKMVPSIEKAFDRFDKKEPEIFDNGKSLGDHDENYELVYGAAQAALRKAIEKAGLGKSVIYFDRDYHI